MKTKTYILSRNLVGQLTNHCEEDSTDCITICGTALAKFFPDLTNNVKLTVSKSRQHRKGEFKLTFHPNIPFSETCYTSIVPRVSFKNVVREQIFIETADRVISDLKLNWKTANIYLYVSLTNIE